MGFRIQLDFTPITDAIDNNTTQLKQIAQHLAEIRDVLKPPTTNLVALKASSILVIDFQTRTIREITNMADATMTDVQKAHIGPVTGVDADGNPAPLPALNKPLLWTLADTTAGTLAVAADGLSADFTPATTLGHLGLQTIHFGTDPSGTDPNLQGQVQIQVNPGPLAGLTAPVTVT